MYGAERNWVVDPKICKWQGRLGIKCTWYCRQLLLCTYIGYTIPKTLSFQQRLLLSSVIEFPFMFTYIISPNCRVAPLSRSQPTPLYTCLTTHRKASVVTQPLVYEKPQSDHKTLPFAFRLTIYIQTPYWPLSGISRNDDFEARPPTRLARVSWA